MGPKQGSLPGGCCLGSVLPAHARGVAPDAHFFAFRVIPRAVGDRNLHRNEAFADELGDDFPVQFKAVGHPMHAVQTPAPEENDEQF